MPGKGAGRVAEISHGRLTSIPTVREQIILLTPVCQPVWLCSPCDKASTEQAVGWLQ